MRECSSPPRLSYRISLLTLILLCSPAWAQEPTETQPHPVELSEDESVEDIEASREPPAADEAPESPRPETTEDQDSAPGKASPEQATRVAPNVDLKDVTPQPQPKTPAGNTANETAPQAPEESTDKEPATGSVAEPTPGTVAEPNSPAESAEPEFSQSMGDLAPGDGSPQQAEAPAEPSPQAEPPPQAQPLVVLGAEVRPGTTTRLSWTPDTSMAGLNQPTPVLVINGAQPGPNLCLTGAVHGDELNGIEIIRRVMYDIQAEKLSGRIIGVPIVNVQGFQRGSRYLPDRRDLNRNFPGDPHGSLASRIAYSLFNDVIKHCDMLVDIHTGSLKRSNLPQLRADMHNSEVARFTEGFDKMAVVHSQGAPGMLRSAATDHGIVAVTMEAGESLRIQENQIEAGVNSVNSLLEKQQMLSRLFVWGKPEPVYYNSNWIRANHGGILVSDVDLGEEVIAGEVLGIVTDPITNAQHPIRAEQDGRVIGMAVDQVVMAGFAAYHIGTEARGPEQAPE